MSARVAVHDTLLRAWAQRGPLACLLWPVSKVYGLLLGLRRGLYQAGWLPSKQVDAVVLVVGNVVAGGAGKTPTVIALVNHLQKRGVRVGVVARGYGRDSDNIEEVAPEADPRQVGDESLLVRRTTQSPVFVGRRRHAAARALLAQYPDTQVIVCDDGLQHYGLYRNLEVCVFDNRGCGNGWLLPAGPLREPWPRQALAVAGQHRDTLLVLHTGTQPAFAGHAARRFLAGHALRADGSRVALDTLQGAPARPLWAVAGIAQPALFFDMLRASELVLERTTALPDHYDFDSFSRNTHEGYQLICTEKDAAKLWRIAPDALAVPLEQTMDDSFFRALDALVDHQLSAKLSSAHGHKTT